MLGEERSNCMQPLTTAARCAVLGIFAIGLALGQNTAPDDTASAGHGWRRVTDPSPAPDSQIAQASAPAQDQVYPRTPDAPPQTAAVPAQLTIKSGTYITVRINQPLSSDYNQPGDAFSATLASPVVVDGIVVAQRGQMVAGRVVEAQKAGRVEGVSRLGIELTELTLVDGQQVALRTQLIGRSGPTSEGRDAAAIGATTATGAAIGAAAGWGAGAAIGAGAGAAAGVIGVLLTRGHPTVIYPESVLTFRVESAVTFSTDHAPQAFRYVTPGDYQQQYAQAQPAPYARPAPPPPAYYYGYYGPAWYPYYWGPSFAFFYGAGFYRPYYGGVYFYGRARGFRR